MALACYVFGHKWDHCRCSRCGKIRDDSPVNIEFHDWNGCTCRLCGAKRDSGHHYQDGVCEICGKRLTKDDLMDMLRPAAYSQFTINELKQIDPVSLLEQAYGMLGPDEADEILVKAYQDVLRTYGKDSRIDEAVRQLIVPFVTEANLPKLYEADSVGLHHVARYLDRDLILNAGSRAGFGEQDRKWFLTKCGIAEEDRITSCDLGDHDYESAGTGWEEKDGVRREYNVYRCRYCGQTYREATGRTDP